MKNEITTINQGVQGLSADIMERFSTEADIRTEATRTTYKAALRRLYDYMQAEQLHDITHADMIHFRETLSTSLSPASVNLYIIGIRRFFEWLIECGYRQTNPAAKVKALQVSREHKRDYFEASEIRSIMATAAGNTLGDLRDAAIIAIMATTGLRCIEIQRADDTDLQRAHGGWRLYIQGKGHSSKDAYVKIEGTAAAKLEAYRNARGASEALFASLPSNASKGGERMTTRSISRIAKQHFIAAGIDDETHTAHSLRHTAATLNLKAGATLEETRQLLRHTNINTTMIYAHALTREANVSERRIDTAIFG